MYSRDFLRPFTWTRRILVSILFSDLIAQIFLIAMPDIGDLRSGESLYETEQDTTWLLPQLALSVVGSILAFIAMMLALQSFNEDYSRRTWIASFTKFITLWIDASLLAYPTRFRLIFCTVSLILHFVEMIVLATLAHRTANFERQPLLPHMIAKPLVHQLEDKHSPLRLEHSMAVLNRLDRYLELKSTRSRLRGQMRRGLLYFGSICGLLVLLSAGTWLREFQKMVMTTDSMFANSYSEDSVVEALGYTSDLINSRTHNTSRVLLIVVDGLRLDYAHNNKDMQTLLNRRDFTENSVSLKLRTQLPSMSVPNWLTLLTGAPPEMTGVLGNLFVPETQFDSIFRQAASFDLMRGMSASPWFADLVRSTLPNLHGDGTIEVNRGVKEGERPSSAPADQMRADVIYEAIGGHCVTYDLFLGHFSDVDLQGHCCGVTEHWNHEDTYDHAVSDKAAILSHIVDILPSDVTLFITSDHGHIDRGGHGGVEDVLRWVPLFIYQKGSGLAHRTIPEPSFEPKDLNGVFYYDSVDIAPTISMLLGIPVPRDSLGTPIREAVSLVTDSSVRLLHYRDLFLQQQAFVKAFFNAMRMIPDAATSRILEKDYAPINSTGAAEYVDSVSALLEAFHNARTQQMQLWIARNVLLTLAIDGLMFLIVLYIMQAHTFCDPLSILSRPSAGRKANTKALLIAAVGVLLYYIMTITIYQIIYFIFGYTIWSSTEVHWPQAMSYYTIISLVPACILEVVYVRLYHAPYVSRPIRRVSFFKQLKHDFEAYITGTKTVYTDLAAIYLARHYVLLMTLLVTLCLFVMQSVFTFILPIVFRIHFITSPTWQLRFIVLTLQFVSLPLMAGSVSMIFLGWPSDSKRTGVFDAVYVLKLQKERRIRSAHHVSCCSTVVPRSINRMAEDLATNDYLRVAEEQAEDEQTDRVLEATDASMYQMTTMRTGLAGAAEFEDVESPYDLVNMRDDEASHHNQSDVSEGGEDELF